MNLEMRWTPPPTPSKPYSPSDIYSKEVLENIPKTIENLWEIIDFRPPKDKERYIPKVSGDIKAKIEIYGEGEFGSLLYSSPCFIISRRITDKDRLEWLLTRYNKEREFYGVFTRPVAVEDIDNEIRKENK